MKLKIKVFISILVGILCLSLSTTVWGGISILYKAGIMTNNRAYSEFFSHKTASFDMLAWVRTNVTNLPIYITNIPTSNGPEQVEIPYQPRLDDLFVDYAYSKHIKSELPYPNPLHPAWGDRFFTIFIDEDRNGSLNYNDEPYREFITPVDSFRQLDIPDVWIYGDLHPTISWSAVPYATVYKIRFQTITEENDLGDIVFVDWHYDLGNTNYTHLGDLFYQYDRLAVTVLAYEELSVPQLFNRSDYTIPHFINGGVDASHENNAPNGGDANNDSILDSEQSFVASVPLVETGTYFTVDTSNGTGSTISNISTHTEEELGVDPDYDLPYGVVKFNLIGLEPGATKLVRIYFHGDIDLGGNPVYRKFNPAYNSWSTIPSTFGTEIIDGQTVWYADIWLTDGGLGDMDGIVDGDIEDPGGPAIINLVPGCGPGTDNNGYIFDNFKQPINQDGSSIFKAGRTIPVKIALTDCLNTPVLNKNLRISVGKVTNAILGDIEEINFEDSGESNSSGTLFRYTETGKQYIYNLSTKVMSAGTYRVTATSENGQRTSVMFSLK